MIMEEFIMQAYSVIKRGYYIVEGNFSPEVIDSLVNEGFEILSKRGNCCKISWYNAKGGAAKAMRTISLEVQQEKLKKFVEDTESLFNFKKDQGPQWCGFQYDKLYPENLTWLNSRGYSRIRIERDSDGVGRFVKISL